MVCAADEDPERNLPSRDRPGGARGPGAALRTDALTEARRPEALGQTGDWRHR